MISCLRYEQAWCVQGPVGRLKGNGVSEGNIAGGHQRCGEVPAPRRRWSIGGRCHGAGCQGRCQGVLGEPWLAQVPSAWRPHGAEEVTGPQSGLRSSKGLCVLWFVATAEAGGPPCSHTPAFWITCAGGSLERITWAVGKEEIDPCAPESGRAPFCQLCPSSACYWQSLTLCSQGKRQDAERPVHYVKNGVSGVNWALRVNNWHGQ